MTLIKYNTAGEQKWVGKFNGPQNYYDFATDMVMDNFGNIYVTGESEDTTGADGSYYPHTATVKFDPSGAVVWSILDPAYNSGASVAVDNIGNVYVTGLGVESGSDGDILTIKYSSNVGIQQISNGIPGAFRLSQNYPNPFNPSTKIRFDLPGSSETRLTVYNSLGKEVAILVNEHLKAGSYEYEFDAGKLTSGIYFYTLSYNGDKETKKMLLIK